MQLHTMVYFFMVTMSFYPVESQGKNRFLPVTVLAALPTEILHAMADVGRGRMLPLYFSGGVVRDWVLGRTPSDIDLTIASGAMDYARELAALLGGAFVPLSPEEGVARVVRGNVCLDVSQFREGTTTIEADLSRRDFSANALAVAFDCNNQLFAENGRIIDPLNGLADIDSKVIRLAHQQALSADPLRMIRAYRFQAVLSWRVDQETSEAIARQSHLIRQVSGERIAAELDLLFGCGSPYQAICDMVKTGLLLHVLPELGPGVGLEQPSSHHLDVFGHSLETLRQMELIVRSPGDFFRDLADEVSVYLQEPRQKIRLFYAALLHDLGKTVTAVEKEGKITFYNHDEAGVGLFSEIACRLRMSNEDRRRIGQLVKQHMWPFHLQNARMRTGVTPKAILKLGKASGDDLVGLFLLTMADSLAGQGPGKPMGMEEGVDRLFTDVFSAYQRQIKPLIAAPLLTGKDLIRELNLTPGPVFKRILDGLLEARVGVPEMTRSEALDWVRDFCRQEKNLCKSGELSSYCP